MSTDQDTMKLKDLANAAATVLQAIEEAPDRAFEDVRGALSGEATVILDDEAADIVLNGGEATVHVRFDAAKTKTNTH